MKLSRTVLINFGVLLALQLAAVGLAIADGADPGLFFLIMSSLSIIFLTGINVVIGTVLAITKKSEPAKQFLLSAFLVGLVGFGLCLAGAGLINL
jgi:hypothetical protein